MKKKQKQIIYTIGLIAGILAIILVAKPNIGQSALGMGTVENQTQWNLGESTKQFFGYDVKVNLVQGVQVGCTTPRVCETNINGCWFGDIDQTTNCPTYGTYSMITPPCSKYGGSSGRTCLYQAPAYQVKNTLGSTANYQLSQCRYNVTVLKDGAPIQTFTGNTNQLATDTVEDLSFKLINQLTRIEGSAFNTVVDNKVITEANAKYFCEGMLTSISLQVPLNKFDIKIVGNKTIITNNWRGFTGDVCVAEQTVSDLKGTCYAVNKEIPVGTSEFDIDLPKESSQLLPIIRNLKIGGDVIGDYSGDWVKLSSASTYTQNIGVTNLTITATTNNENKVVIMPVGNLQGTTTLEQKVNKEQIKYANTSGVLYIIGAMGIVFIALITFIFVKKKK